jgi:hypothetical protein
MSWDQEVWVWSKGSLWWSSCPPHFEQGDLGWRDWQELLVPKFCINASHDPWMWSAWSPGVLKHMCCQCVCECRGSLCGIFEQNVMWSKDENTILWRKSYILKWGISSCLVLGLWCLSLYIKSLMSFIVQTAKCLHYELKGYVCLVQSLSWRCT